MKRGISNVVRLRTLSLLRQTASKHDAPIWTMASRLLRKSKRQRVAVNLSKVNRYSKSGDTILIPGKALSQGKLGHPVTLTAFTISSGTTDKVLAAGGRCLTIQELVAANPKGSNVRLMG